MDINMIKSELKMENLYFPECTIIRSSDIKKGPLSMDLEKNVDKLDDYSYAVKLTLLIKKEDSDLMVKVVAMATFTMNNSDPELVNVIMNKNTVAIMFPFIRSQVSLLTTQPGMTPIVLPPINTEKI